MLLAGLLLAAAAAGCGRKKSDVGGELPVMPVSHPIARVVTDYADFTGRTDAKFSVNIVARVTGYLVPVEKPVKQASEAKEADPAVNRQEGGYAFKEGSEVKKGDLLFLIDPRPYQAQYDQAQSQVTLDEAQLNLAKTTLARYQALNKDTPGAVSEQALDQYKAAVVEAEARVFAQRKSLEVYKLNKDFTHVVSPIDGQVSRYYLTLGNLVNQDQTLLTTIVSLDPMYVYFDMDESTYLQILKTIKEGKGTPAGDGDVSILLGSQVLLGLQNEDDKFPHTATIDFVNNQVNSTTGSITVRGVFANPPLVPATQASSTAAGKAPSMEKASAADAAKNVRSGGCAGGKGLHSSRREQRAAGPPAIQARHVRACPAAGWRAAPSAAGHRPGHPERPGAQIRFCPRHGEQVAVPVYHAGLPAAGRPPRRGRGNQAGRLGHRGRDPASPRKNGSQTGPEADADAERASRGGAAAGWRSKARSIPERESKGLKRFS